MVHEISSQQLFPGDPGIQALSHGILSYVMGFLFSFGNTASVFIGAYILYTFTHKIVGYFYKASSSEWPTAGLRTSFGS